MAEDLQKQSIVEPERRAGSQDNIPLEGPETTPAHPIAPPTPPRPVRQQGMQFNPLLSSPCPPEHSPSPDSTDRAGSISGAESDGLEERESQPERFASDWSDSERQLSHAGSTELDEMAVDDQLEPARQNSEPNEELAGRTRVVSTQPSAPVYHVPNAPRTPVSSPAPSHTSDPRCLFRQRRASSPGSRYGLPAPSGSKEPVILVPNSDSQSSTSSNASSQPHNQAEPMALASSLEETARSTLSRLTPHSLSPPLSMPPRDQSQRAMDEFRSDSDQPSSEPQRLAHNSPSMDEPESSPSISCGAGDQWDSRLALSAEDKHGRSFTTEIKTLDSSPLFPPTIDPCSRSACPRPLPDSTSISQSTEEKSVLIENGDEDGMIEDGEIGAHSSKLSSRSKPMSKVPRNPSPQPSTRVRKAIEDLEGPVTKRPRITPMKPLITQPPPTNPGFSRVSQSSPLPRPFLEGDRQPGRLQVKLTAHQARLSILPDQNAQRSESTSKRLAERPSGFINHDPAAWKKPNFDRVTSKAPKHLPEIIDLTADSDSEPQNEDDTKRANETRRVPSTSRKSLHPPRHSRSHATQPCYPNNQKPDMSSTRKMAPTASGAKAASNLLDRTTAVETAPGPSPRLDAIRKLGLDGAVLGRPPPKGTTTFNSAVITPTRIIPHLDLKAMRRKSRKSFGSHSKATETPPQKISRTANEAEVHTAGDRKEKGHADPALCLSNRFNPRAQEGYEPHG